MPGINIKLSGTEFPRTTVEAAIMRGRWKVQEARRLREEQAARSEETTPATTGMEQGDMLDPFNITTALRMRDGHDEKEDKDGHNAADAKKPVGDMLKAEQKDKIPAGREKKENVAEDRGRQEVSGLPVLYVLSVLCILCVSLYIVHFPRIQLLVGRRESILPDARRLPSWTVPLDSDTNLMLLPLRICNSANPVPLICRVIQPCGSGS